MKEEFLLSEQHFKIYYRKLFFRLLTHVRIPRYEWYRMTHTVWAWMIKPCPSKFSPSSFANFTNFSATIFFSLLFNRIFSPFSSNSWTAVPCITVISSFFLMTTPSPPIPSTFSSLTFLDCWPPKKFSKLLFSWPWISIYFWWLVKAQIPLKMISNRLLN